MRCIRKNKKDNGYALIFTLMAFGALTALVSLSMERSQVDVSLAGTVNRRTRAAMISESGLGITARVVVDSFNQHGTIDDLLDTVQFGSSGGGEYGVIVVDNSDVGGSDQDGDGNSNTDSDRIFRLVSTGQVGTSEHIVEGFFRIVDNSTPVVPPDSSGIGALGICASHANLSRASNIQGDDYNVPGYPCSGAGCRGTSNSNPSAPGLSYNVGTTVSLSGGSPGGSPGVDNNAGIDCAAWQTFLERAAAVATSTFAAADGPFNGDDIAEEFGTPTAPKIVVITGPGTAQFNGNLYGNGILIIRNATAQFNGTFTYTGLVLIEDNGGGIDLAGTGNLFGSTMILSATANDSQIEVDIKSSPSRVRYSTQALARAAAAVPPAEGDGTLQLVAWRTVTD